MKTLASRALSILVLTVLGGCAGADLVAPKGSDVTADGARIAQSSGLAKGGILDTVGVSTTLNNTGLTFDFSTTLNATPSIASAFAADPKIAILTIFADSTDATSSGSSGACEVIRCGTHAFITVRNNSSSPITVGKVSGVQPGKTVSIGTWSNTVATEHSGVWYDLEANRIYTNKAYSKRVSVASLMSSTELAKLTSFITNNDRWSKTSNCSWFAVNAWNSVVASYSSLSAGVPNTPLVLARNIKTTTYTSGGAVPYDYLVYYAQGTGTPKRSTVYK